MQCALPVSVTPAARRASAQSSLAASRLNAQPRSGSARLRRRALTCSVRSEATGDGPSAKPSPAAAPAPAPAPAASAAAAAPDPSGSSGPLIAGIAAGFGAVLFAATRLGGGPTLSSLESLSIPYDQALANGRPTVVEFYADWCEICRETAPTVYSTEKGYAGAVNFVMMNVDNTKWASEMRDFGVDGIPHFVFLDGQGRSQGQIIGRLPKDVLEGDLQALVKGDPLPYARYNGFASRANAPDLTEGSTADPRSHA